jgi:hypothetical protein
MIMDSLYEVVDVANEENTTRLLVTDRNEYYPNIYGQEIYLLGGKDTNESWIINSTKIESTSFDETMVSTMGITNEKQEVTCVSIDSSIVCLGGMIGTLYTDEIDHFDLEYIEILDLQNVQTTTFEEALINARVYHSATLLPNNKVLIIGGGVSANISNSAEIFDPLTGESVELPWRMRIPRNGHTATLLPDGRVLVVGGNPGDTTMEVFNPPVQ